MQHLFLTGVALVMAATFAFAADADRLSVDEVIIALKPDKNPDVMLAERKRLGEVLGREVGKPVKVIVPLSAAVILEGLKNGSIDLAYVSATEMATIRDAGAGSILLAGERDGRPYYMSYWVALKESPLAAVEDLKGHPVAFSSKTSTSGFLVPMVDLKKKGLLSDKGDPEEFFGKGNVWYGTGYVSAVERVLRGEADAAAVSFYVLDEDKHLTAEQRAKLKKVAEQGPVPTHVVAVSSKLNPADRTLLKNALLALRSRKDDVSAAIFSAELVEVDEARHLEPIDAAQRLLGLRK